jgi:hypothetical protein
VVSVHWNASRRPPITGVREKVRKLLNFCSPLFISQDAKIISIYRLGLILHFSTWNAKAFHSAHLVIFWIFLFCFILLYSFVFYPIRWIVPGNFIIYYLSYYSSFREKWLSIFHNIFTALFVGKDLSLFIVCVYRYQPDDGWCGQPKHVAALNT